MSASERQTSVTTSSISREDLHKLAIERAFEVKSAERTIGRWLCWGAGVVVLLAFLAWSAQFVRSPLELLLAMLAGLMFAIPVVLGMSTVVAPLGAVAARRRFVAHARTLGLTDVDAAAAYAQATQVVDDLTRGRLVTGAQAPSERK
jgi:hypothetical protein